MSQGLLTDANEVVKILQEHFAPQEATLKVERRCAERLLADAMRDNSAKDERIALLLDPVSETSAEETSLHKLLDVAKQLASRLEEQKTVAQRSIEDVLELLGAENANSAELLQTNKQLKNELGGLQLELDIASDEKVNLQEEVAETHEDLDVAGENACLWQMVAEKRLDELPCEEQVETKPHALEELWK